MGEKPGERETIERLISRVEQQGRDWKAKDHPEKGTVRKQAETWVKDQMRRIDNKRTGR